MSMDMHMMDPTVHDLPLSDPRCNTDDCFVFEVAHNESQATISYYRQYDYGHWLAWYYTIIIFLFMLAYIADRLRKPSSPKDASGPSTWGRVKACWRFVGYRRLSGGISDRLGLPAFGMTLFLLAGVLVIFVMSFAVRPYYRGHRGYGSPPFAIRTGLMAASLTPLLIALSGKFNLVTLLTGIGYERLNVIHRWVGWAIFGLSVAHTIPFVVAPLRDGGYAALREQYYSEDSYEYTGTPPLAILFGIVVCSLPIVRHRVYESFYLSHILLGVTYVGLCFWHFDNEQDSWTYLWATVGLWLLGILPRVFYKNRAFQITRSWPDSFPTRVSSLPGYVTRVDVAVPGDISWLPGQHCYLRLPYVAPLDNHPFTIASAPSTKPDDEKEAPSQQTMTFLIRGYSGFTGKLLALGKSKGVFSTQAWIEGPYGSSIHKVEDTFDRMIMIAGGSGITACLSWLSYLSQKMSAHDVRLVSVKLIWVVRRHEHVEWVQEKLQEAKQTQSKRIDVELFVTQEELPENMPMEVKEIVEKETDTKAGSIDQLSIHQEVIEQTIGRPFIPQLLPDMLHEGRNLVLACGPESLKIDVSNACASAQQSVLRGEIEAVTLHTETFGWG